MYYCCEYRHRGLPCLLHIWSSEIPVQKPAMIYIDFLINTPARSWTCTLFTLNCCVYPHWPRHTHFCQSCTCGVVRYGARHHRSDFGTIRATSLLTMVDESHSMPLLPPPTRLETHEIRHPPTLVLITTNSRPRSPPPPRATLHLLERHMELPEEMMREKEARGRQQAVLARW